MNNEHTTLLSDEQLITVKQVITNLDHIVNERFDEIRGFVPYYGLCANVFNDLEDEYPHIVEDMFNSWGSFSGYCSHPVLGVDEYYDCVVLCKSQYDLSTENGRLILMIN